MRLLSIITAAASLSTLSACGGGTLDAEEAQRVFQTMYMVTATVSAESATQVSTSASKSWTVDQDEDGYAFSGTIEGTGFWTGTIELSGTLVMTPQRYEYQYEMVFIGVASNGVVLDGETGMELAMETEDDGSMEYRYQMYGDITATGEATGTAAFDYSMDLEYDATTGVYTYTYSGEIGGHDVSGMSASGSTQGFGPAYGMAY